MFFSLACLVWSLALLLACFTDLTWFITVLRLTERFSRQALQNSLPNEQVSFSPGNSCTLLDGCTFSLVLSALLPEDLFFPLGGLRETFLFLESSEVLGAFNLSSKDTTGVTGLGPDSMSDSEDEPDLEDSAELAQTIELELEAILQQASLAQLQLHVAVGVG